MIEDQVDLIAQADRLHEQATALLEESDLIATLGRFGAVQPTGSFRHRLMLQPDIDLYLINSDAGRRHAKEVLNHLIDQSWWNSYHFGDWVSFRHLQLPEGYYLGLKHTFLELRWKVDIWDLPRIPEQVAAFGEELDAHLRAAGRQPILDLKRFRDTVHLPVSSKQIYDWVLAGTVHSRETLLAVAADVIHQRFQRSRGVGTMSVRLASIDDRFAIARIHIEASKRGHAGIMPSEWLARLDEDWLAELWAKRFMTLDLERNRIWVAVEDDDVLGFAWVSPAEHPDEHAYELHLIYVVPHRWGSGVAHELMASVLEFLRTENTAAAILWTAERDLRARRFYEKFGWHFDGSTHVDKLLGGEVAFVRYRLTSEGR